MKGKSILLALSGSRQSRFAGEVCWRLAGKLGAFTTAHHVVDSHSAWEFLGHENPGFLDANEYLDAYQQLVSSLFKLGEKLADSYAAEAKARSVDDVCIVDEGNPVSEICRRALDHKLVVIGHRRFQGEAKAPSQFLRLSIAESLSHDCPRPLLVVQDQCENWSSLSIMISLDHINEIYINSCLEMAESLQIQPALVCLTGGAHEEKPERFVHDIRESNPRLSEVPIALTPARRDIAVQMEHWYAPPGMPFDRELWSNTLVVIPTRMVGGERLTVVDSSPSIFVRHLTLPSILLWPEEFVFSLADSELLEQSGVGKR